MKLTWISIVLSLTAPIFATPVTCTTGTLAAYQALNTGCSIGDKLFSGFVFTQHVGPTITSAQITVTPVTGPDIGLTFSSTVYTVSGLTTMDYTLNYNTTTLSGNATIVGLKEILSASFTGAGQVTVDDNGFTSGIIPFHMSTNDSAVTNKFMDSTNVAATNSVSSSYDLFVNAAGGSATINSVTNLFVQTPEPSSLLLMGAGALVLGLARRRERERRR
jgi:hypothetical protein